MVTNNKVLTVSYGTFSCTLEGFDDSFDTMKSIAEYFRDLAADDRYFGAEPPTPDAEMLARIAEREIARQVVARQDDGTIHLRAAEQGAAPAVAPVATPPVATPVAEPAPAAPAPVAETAVEPPAAKEPVIEEPAVVEDPAVEIAPESVVAEAPVEAPVEEVIDATAEEAPIDIEPAAAEADDDSVANKLRRIRAVVSRNAEAAPIEKAINVAADYAEEEYSEDEHAEEAPQEQIQELVEDVAHIDSEPEDADTLAAATAELNAEDDTDAAVLAAIAELNAEAAADVTEDVEPEETHIEVSEDVAAEAEDDFGAILAAVRNAEEEEAAIDAPVEELAEKEEPVEDVTETTEPEAPEADVALENEITPEPATVRSVRPVRVIKMRRADYEAGLATEAPDASEAGPATEATPAEMQDDGALSAEEEADLLRELAEVEAEFAEEPEQDLAPDEVRSIFAEEAGETDVSRLMDKTVSEMDNPEGTHRRNAIAHLRAAVQATRAESDAGSVLNDRAGASHAYREDLNTVVRPKRRAPETDTEEVAPLKLVAEQRVDDTPAPVEQPAAAAPVAPQAVKPVRPRRVRKLQPQQPVVDSAAPSPAAFSSFAEFAETMGAQELPDMLEAAASYLSHVEGLDQFSRPQLMKKARQIETLEFSREDGLRSFGQLLRDGKIEKLQGGRFTVSDQIGFNPKARAAG
ncbi:hypothetical protein [Thalassobius sp. Cn5-15]|uniref:hypothetical protein n=1 Tax=Thalassobius sp. Cn5-15 TaxID=2917763 RepID=UPI001EF2A227|nr:hypothetical protein [Thalassobius sp. Cn5-15]MCG7493142.1 hypothetical protein [Thalassobius sp. Cn5-15]